MMKVVFYEKRRETLTSVGGVIQIQSSYSQIRGRPVKVWLLLMESGKDLVYKKCDYDIDRVEI